jgi:serine/threonine protein kinase
MSHASTSKPCPKCAELVPVDAPGGLCPKCLLAQAAASSPGDSLPAEGRSPPSLEAVRVAFPQLEIQELIGQGGMGAVFKARQPKLNRLVALKILPERLAADTAFAERFAREGQMLARLNHPNIVAIHDFGESDGFYYLLMEFVEGVNLRQALRAGGFTPPQALGIVPKICEALQYAHDEGVLHRDIKPENILLDVKGRVKIADFGIAKLAREPAPGEPLTAAGAALGTPYYMAPEQIERPSDVDHRADIYSLGVVFYELLTGELPLGRFAPPSEKAAVDARVDEVVLQAMEHQRERRQQSAAQMKAQVETIASAGMGGGPQTGLSLEASPASDNPPVSASPEAAPRPRRLFRTIVAWVAVPVVLVVGLFGTFEISRERGHVVTTMCLLILFWIVVWLILWALDIDLTKLRRDETDDPGEEAP